MNALLNAFGSSVPEKEAISLEQTRKFLELGKRVKRAAESVLDLGLASSLSADTSLRFRFSEITQKEQRVNSIIADCYNGLALNAGTIGRALEIVGKGLLPCVKDDVDESAKDRLAKLLTTLRDREVALTLSKSLNEYENTTLRGLIESCLAGMGKYESAVDQAFSRLCDSFKDRLLSKLSVRFAAAKPE